MSRPFVLYFFHAAFIVSPAGSLMVYPHVRRGYAVQEAAWPLIAGGENVLAIAPTGSGKTLTAFLAAISCFIDGSYDPAALAVLYLSPLKALSEDIRRNILEPLRSLRSHFALAGSAFPDIRVETRSGDTPESERRRFFAIDEIHPALAVKSGGGILRMKHPETI
ncbi:MAG: DEAD/DEAH box helicase [Spirochaetaceae bacterium]|nr:DEAD/DEAH box helicase [Spirochaetaceae bacterium]